MNRGRSSRIRWRIGALLFAVVVVNFFQRLNITVAADSMMKDYRLSQTQMGTVFSASLLGYTLFQVPGGMLADRFGPKKVLGWAMLLWGLFSVLTGMSAKISALIAMNILGVLIALRFAFGVCQGPMFPASTRMIANWFPISERARGNGLVISGLSVGSFLMPPLVSWIITQWYWQSSFYAASICSLVAIIPWIVYVKDNPSQHHGVNSAELKFIQTSDTPYPESATHSSIGSPLGSGNFWRLVISYTLNGYVGYIFVFWFYLYLVQVRHFGQPESAWLTTVPWILAALTTFGGGYLSDRLITTRLGMDWARRIVPIGCQTGAAILIAIGSRVENGYVAAAILAVCTGLILGTEGPYWAAANQIPGGSAGFKGGLLNTGGNFGGVISPTLTPFIAQRFGWVHALDFASLVALGAAALWLWISLTKKPEFTVTQSPQRS